MNQGVTPEMAVAAVRKVVDACLSAGITLSGCGCCGSVDCGGVQFDTFSVEPNPDSVGSVDLNISYRTRVTTLPWPRYSIEVFGFRPGDPLQVKEK